MEEKFGFEKKKKDLLEQQNSLGNDDSKVEK